MKYWVLISQIRKPISGIEAFPLDLVIFRINQDTYELQGIPQRIYSKVQTAPINSTQFVSNAHVRLFSIEVPDEEAVPTAKQLTREWLQLEAFLSDLAKLKERVACLSVGWFPWTVSKARDIQSKIEFTLAEIKGMVQQHGVADAQVVERVESIQQLVDEIEREAKRQQGKIESRSHWMNLIYFILGLVIGYILSILPSVRVSE